MSFLSEESLLESTWCEFERIILRLFQHLGWKGLMFTAKSHDKGADIIGTHPEKSYPIVIQCKHTGSNITNSKALEELANACDFYGATRGILATNAQLGKSGKQRLKQLNEIYQFIEWNFNVLTSLSNTPSILNESKAKKQPRKYQQAAIDSIKEQYFNSDRGLVMFATGLGKSIILAEIASFVCEETEKPVLILADKTALIEQLEQSIWPQLSSSIPTRLWDSKRKPRNINHGITVATYQSVRSAIGNGMILPNFGAVLVDECHHALAPDYQICINNLDKDYLLGVTATPWRGDQQRITDFFGDPISTMGIVEGIENGFLAKVNYEMFLDDVDWKTVNELSENHMKMSDLNSRLFLPSRDEDLCSTVYEKWESIGKPQCITFCKSIDHAERLAELFSSMGIISRAVHSKGMQQAEVTKNITEFRGGKFQNLIGVDILNEGIDVPDVGMVIFARVTHSRRIFVQQLGRGLRVTDDKNSVQVLDFVADIRRISEGLMLNHERLARNTTETYRGRGADMVSFISNSNKRFTEEFLIDIADLEDNDHVRLDFITPTD